MSKLLSTLMATLIVLFFAACSQKFPENYGIYCYEGKNSKVLVSQKLKFAGNVSESITGLAGPAGPEFKSLSYIIVFEKDIDPKNIQLVRMEFQKIGSVENIAWQTPVEVKFWVPSKIIEFDITPVAGKKDMYKITPKTQLPTGFYALHNGGLRRKQSTIDVVQGLYAFDFVIGNKSDYLSNEDRIKITSANINSEADRLLTDLNKYFNASDYDGMKAVYRPQGRNLAGAEWDEFVKGLKTWKRTAGNIVKSEIINRSFDDETGTFELRTTYSIKGAQREEMLVAKIDGKFDIISLE